MLPWLCTFAFSFFGGYWGKCNPVVSVAFLRDEPPVWHSGHKCCKDHTPATLTSYLGSVCGRRWGCCSCRCLSTLFIWLRSLRRSPWRWLCLHRGGHSFCLVSLRSSKAGVLLPAVDALVDDGDGDVASPELGVSHVSFSCCWLLGRWTVCWWLAFLGVKNTT